MSATLHFLNRGLAGTGDGERFSFCGGWNVCYKPEINNPKESIVLRLKTFKGCILEISFLYNATDEIIPSLIFGRTSLSKIYVQRSSLINSSVI